MFEGCDCCLQSIYVAWTDEESLEELDCVTDFLLSHFNLSVLVAATQGYRDQRVLLVDYHISADASFFGASTFAA